MLTLLLFLFAASAAVASVDTTCGLNVLGSLDNTKVNKASYALVYVLSCTLGGAVTGLAIGGINYLLSLTPLNTSYNAIIIIMFAVFILLELFNKSGLLPAGNFIVPSEWIRQAGYRSAALWGHILGMGFITLQAGVLFHAYVLLSIFAPAWWLSLLAGICFGFVRGTVFSLPLIRSVVHMLLEKRWLKRTLLSAVRLVVSYVLLTGSILWILLS
ncbi:hypothetical protein [Paenibacillus ihbetae]|uniref:Urease accessory protein UreH-like transmembrane domain-containing protein n=1 Tax=Paenibacillus ihbetae TaxID=1870820 RepID=A0A1B2E7D5_9BACL|nr:hypothetical protein [Paenibacillus ihbetae]ANY75890.1 hypothetical protein BBD41_26780 [Paenibacillus ihbetae]OOC61941.1 hypothetical protein BBD40_08790 [Paenibacillus ihbetae]